VLYRKRYGSQCEAWFVLPADRQTLWRQSPWCLCTSGTRRIRWMGQRVRLADDGCETLKPCGNRHNHAGAVYSNIFRKTTL